MKLKSIKQQIYPFLTGLILLIFAGCSGGGDGMNEDIPDIHGDSGGSEAPILSVTPGDGQNILTLTPATGSTATTYNIYWANSPIVTTTTGTKIADVTSPFTHDLTNGTLIYYVATAVAGVDESSPSAIVGGMPGKWTALNLSTSPPVRDSHTAVYNSDSDKMIVFGGKDTSTTLQDLWVLTGVRGDSPTWTTPDNIDPPLNRSGHTAVYNNVDNKMFVFGGTSQTDGSGQLNDLYSLPDADTTGTFIWQILTTTTSPSPREGHAAVYDEDKDIMVVFGGAQRGVTLFDDVWILERATKVNASWSSISATGGPSARCCMASAYDAANHRMIIFGGFGGSSSFNDLWTLTFSPDFLSATWQELTPSGGTSISARCCAVSLWDGSKLLLFGGGTFNSSSDDKIYAIFLQSSTFTAIIGPAGGPTARIFPTAVPAGHFLLFGGTSEFQPLNDLWRLD